MASKFYSCTSSLLIKSFDFRLCVTSAFQRAAFLLLQATHIYALLIQIIFFISHLWFISKFIWLCIFKLLFPLEKFAAAKHCSQRSSTIRIASFALSKQLRVWPFIHSLVKNSKVLISNRVRLANVERLCHRRSYLEP